MSQLNNFRSFFPIFQKHPQLVYFNTATTALKPLAMIKALENFYMNNGLSLRTAAPFSLENNQAIEKTRQKTATFLNVQAREIIFTIGTTDGLNIIMQSLADIILPDDCIVTSVLEHNSSLLPWMRIAQQKGAKLIFIPLDENHQITVTNFQKVLSVRTKFVVLTHMSNILGYEIPIKAITCLARQQNALVILDAAQSIGHLALDVKDLDVDFIAFSTHKIYGPFGLGVLFGKEHWLKKFNPPFIGGGGASAISPQQFIFNDLPHKWSSGTPNIGAIIAWQKTLDFIMQIGYQRLQQHEQKITQQILQKLTQIPHIMIFNPHSDYMVTFNFQNIHAHDVESFLAKNNIYVRADQHCSNLGVQTLKQNAIVRISVGLHNNQNDIDILIRSLTHLQKIWASY